MSCVSMYLNLQKSLSILDNYSPIDASEALETLLVYMDNIIKNPNNIKYRCVRISNINYQERLGHMNSGLLESLGFEQSGDFLKLDIHYFSADIPSSNEQANIESNNLVTFGSITDLKKMRSLVDERLTVYRSQWTEYSKSPDSNHIWQSIQGFTAADSIGKRATMEDEYIAIDCFGGEEKSGFFALYDGHGGRSAVDFVVRALHLNLEIQLKAHPNKTIAQIYDEVYLKTDAQIRRQNILSCGSTSVTCLLRVINGVRVCNVANVGDSRAILCRGGKAIRLTKDHKPTDPEETARVVASGGFIGRFGRVNGILAISRALGDHMLKAVVSASPYTYDIEVVNEDDFIILACDGVWDVMSDQDAVDFVLEKVSEAKHETPFSVDSIANSLVNLALQKNTMDNVTVMIVFLKVYLNLFSSFYY